MLGNAQRLIRPISHRRRSLRCVTSSLPPTRRTNCEEGETVAENRLHNIQIPAGDWTPAGRFGSDKFFETFDTVIIKQV